MIAEAAFPRSLPARGAIVYNSYMGRALKTASVGLLLLGLFGCTTAVHVVNISDAAVTVKLSTLPPASAIIESGGTAVFEKVPSGFFDPDTTLEATGDFIDPVRRRLILFNQIRADFTVSNNLTWLIVSNLGVSNLTLLYVWPVALGSNYGVTSNMLTNQAAIEPQGGRAFRIAMGGGTNHLRTGGTGFARQIYYGDLSNLGRTVALYSGTNFSLRR